MSGNKSQPWLQAELLQHCELLLYSFHLWTGQDLLPVTNYQSSSDRANALNNALSNALFNADFVIVSHGTQADPVLNYGNQKALDLWQMDWETFTKTPSRYTAEPMERSEREELLAQAKLQGYISNYRGIRIASNGDRFYINRAIIWNVVDQAGNLWGQAATFRDWEPI